MSSKKRNAKPKKERFIDRVDPPELLVPGFTNDEVRVIFEKLDPDMQATVSFSWASGNKEQAKEIFQAACGLCWVRSLENLSSKLLEELSLICTNDKMREYVKECLDVHEELQHHSETARVFGYNVATQNIPDWILEVFDSMSTDLANTNET